MIYFIQCGDDGPIKIGYASKDIDGRLQSMQTGCPYTLSIIAKKPGTRQDEHELHQNFAKYRIRGEWFHPSKKLIYYIHHKGKGLNELRCEVLRLKRAGWSYWDIGNKLQIGPSKASAWYNTAKKLEKNG